MRQAGAVAGVCFGIEEVKESSVKSLPVQMEDVKRENAKEERTENGNISGIPEGVDLFGFDSVKSTEIQEENSDTPSPIPQIGMISDLVFFAAPLDP